MSATQQLWPADQVERWDISRLVPYARNARTHSDAQVAQIAAYLRARFGDRPPWPANLERAVHRARAAAAP